VSDNIELTTSASSEQSGDVSTVDDGVVVLTNGVRVLNTSLHPFAFADGTMVPPCGTTLNAIFEECPATHILGLDPVVFVRTEKVSTPEGRDFISAVPDGVLILGSAIAAEAYGYPVVMAVPTAETSGRGTPPADKRMRIDRFTLG